MNQNVKSAWKMCPKIRPHHINYELYKTFKIWSTVWCQNINNSTYNCSNYVMDTLEIIDISSPQPIGIFFYIDVASSDQALCLISIELPCANFI